MEQGTKADRTMRLLARYGDVPFQKLEVARLYATGSQSTGFLTAALTVLALSPHRQALMRSTDLEKAEVEQWLGFVAERDFKVDDASSLAVLNSHLESRTFFAGNRLSAADLVVYAASHEWVATTSDGAKNAHYHLVRWFDLMQHLPCVAGDDFPVVELAKMVVGKTATKPTGDAKPKKEKPAKNEKPAKDSKKAAEKKAAVDRSPDDVTRLAFTVGKIVDVREHPNADKMFVEMIDVGEKEPREICSGLRGLISKEELLGANCVVVSNLKPRKLRGILSNGMVLCASNADHTQCELMQAPEGTPVGELLRFGELQGLPDKVIPAGSGPNVFMEVVDDLNTDDSGRGRWRDVVVTSSRGPVTCKSLFGGSMS